jgi:hypothetical protein
MYEVTEYQGQIVVYPDGDVRDLTELYLGGGDPFFHAWFEDGEEVWGTADTDRFDSLDGGMTAFAFQVGEPFLAVNPIATLIVRHFFGDRGRTCYGSVVFTANREVIDIIVDVVVSNEEFFELLSRFTELTDQDWPVTHGHLSEVCQVVAELLAFGHDAESVVVEAPVSSPATMLISNLATGGDLETRAAILSSVGDVKAAITEAIGYGNDLVCGVAFGIYNEKLTA